jgi:hypothetical protein
MRNELSKCYIKDHVQFNYVFTAMDGGSNSLSVIIPYEIRNKKS